MRKKTHEEYVLDLLKKNPNIEVIMGYINDGTKILHKCKICSHEWNVAPHGVLSGTGCPVCSGNKIGNAPEYKNSIWSSKYKELAISYSMSEEQMKTIMPMSEKKINVRCPNCGAIKYIAPKTLFMHGLGCNSCSDGISYPEKFIASILNQLQINYIPQYSPDWANRKRYDFYLKDYNCIIEAHGLQHYENKSNKFNSLILEMQNDKEKEHLARQNSIINYICVDCRESNMEWIKKSIIKSNIFNILNFNEEDIDWEKCNKDAISSKIRTVADLWNSNTSITVGDIAKQIKAGDNTVARWLKKSGSI